MTRHFFGTSTVSLPDHPLVFVLNMGPHRMQNFSYNPPLSFDLTRRLAGAGPSSVALPRKARVREDNRGLVPEGMWGTASCALLLVFWNRLCFISWFILTCLCTMRAALVCMHETGTEHVPGSNDAWLTDFIHATHFMGCKRRI